LLLSSLNLSAAWREKHLSQRRKDAIFGKAFSATLRLGVKNISRKGAKTQFLGHFSATPRLGVKNISRKGAKTQFLGKPSLRLRGLA
jgi:hypothetical protein